MDVEEKQRIVILSVRHANPVAATAIVRLQPNIWAESQTPCKEHLIWVIRICGRERMKRVGRIQIMDGKRKGFKLNIVDVKIMILEEGKGLALPSYATPGAAGMDLYAALNGPFLGIDPGERFLISSGIAIALPEGYEAQIRPRRGLALNKGITIINSPGTIDSDYRGPMGITLINHGKYRVVIRNGERIGQMVIAPVTRVRWVVETVLDSTERGAGGFGSTG